MAENTAQAAQYCMRRRRRRRVVVRRIPQPPSTKATGKVTSTKLNFLCYSTSQASSLQRWLSGRVRPRCLRLEDEPS